MDAALELFAQQGYQATSIRDVAAKAGITGGALYRHFDSKEDLLAATFDAGAQILQHGLADTAELPPRPAMEGLVRSYALAAVTQPNWLIVWGRERSNLPTPAKARITADQQEYVRIWVAAVMRLRPALDEPAALQLVSMALGFINAAPHMYLGATGEELVELLTGSALALLKQPLRAPEGSKAVRTPR